MQRFYLSRGSLPVNLRQNCLQQRQGSVELFHFDHEIPEGLKLFPATGVGQVLQKVFRRVMRPAGLEQIFPAVELMIRLVIPLLQFLRRHPLGLVNNLPRVV